MEDHYDCEITEIELSDEIAQLKDMIYKLCNIIESEYPESDDRYEFAMKCLSDVGEK